MKQNGFTLSELLIALVILGLIATFTIPKVLQSQQSSQYKSMAKEVSATMSGALQAYKQENGVTLGTRWTHITQYINYVNIDTTSTIDFNNDGTTRDCFAAFKLCLKLHNGGIVMMDTTNQYASTAATQAMAFHFDPNGKADGSNQPGTGIQMWLYYNGKLRTNETLDSNTCVNGTTCTYGPIANTDPPWFGWN